MKTKKPAASEDVVQEALRLSAVDKVRLMERLAAVLRYDVVQSDGQPPVSAGDLLAHLGPAPSEEDIDEARRDMLAGTVFDRDG